MERWKEIKGFEGLYAVSTYGNVKSLDHYVMNRGAKQFRHGRILKINHQKGCSLVVLSKDGTTYARSVHRLVAEAFIPNEENKPNVDHIDTNPNNNHVENLRWVTQHENAMNPLTRIHNSESKKGHKCYLSHHSEETKEKLRQLNTGKKYSDEVKKKMSVAHLQSELARTISKENIKKAHDVNRGSHRSEETKEKIRNAVTGAHKGKTWTLINGKRVWKEREETA